MPLCGEDHPKLVARINRIEGQVRGLKKMKVNLNYLFYFVSWCLCGHYPSYLIQIRNLEIDRSVFKIRRISGTF